MSEQSGTFDISAPGPLVAELVGEGKKFKSVDDLAKGKIEADGFIEKLKVENAALREALNTEADPDEILKRIGSLLQAKSERSTTNTPDQTSNQSQSTAAPLTEEKVLELLSKREQEDKIRQNINSFNANVTKAFGDKTGEVIASRLDELGMDEAQFKDLAARNPNAALRILGLKEGGVSAGSMSSSVNTEAFFGEAGKGNGEVQNFAYFTKLRRELGERYYEPHIQKQVFEARKKLGDAFWK
jgi:hypothetical protein